MSAFWIVGILLNIVFFAAAMYWIVKEWKKNSAKNKSREGDGQNHK